MPTDARSNDNGLYIEMGGDSLGLERVALVTFVTMETDGEANRIKQDRIAELKKVWSHLLAVGYKGKSLIGYKNRILSEISLLQNNITFISGYNLATLEHPLTKKKSIVSLVNNKTCFNKKWSNKIPFEMLLKWFHASDLETALSYEYDMSNV